MKPWVRIDEGRTPDGTLLELYQRGDEFTIRANNEVLMGTRTQGSEIALAELGIGALAKTDGARILVGGLGCGYTLRAALDAVPDNAQVAVAELVPAVVEWNRGVLGPFANQPLSDPRASVLVGDIVELMKRAKPNSWDAILLDVDNGPRGMTQAGNGWLYKGSGIACAKRILKPGGALATWSASDSNDYTRRLTSAGFHVARHPTRARGAKGGARHMIWVAARR